MNRVWLIDDSTTLPAGTEARAGYYSRTDVPHGPVFHHAGGPLPASCDGSRAVYTPAEEYAIPSRRAAGAVAARS